MYNKRQVVLPKMKLHYVEISNIKIFKNRPCQHVIYLHVSNAEQNKENRKYLSASLKD